MAFFIAVAGPSGSGKSVFCRSFQQKYQHVTRLKLDDFFKDVVDMPLRNGCADWDRPESLKWEQMIQAARDLKAGRHAAVPHYSRRDDRQIGEKCVLPSPVVLLDGFMTLHHPEIRELIDVALFFDLSEELQVSRRQERQPNVSETYLYEIMLPAARKYILPSKVHAHAVIDASQSKADVLAQCEAVIGEKIDLVLK